MIGLQGRGSAFFAIQGLNIDEGVIDPKDLVSLSVTEELDKITLGSIKFHDRYHIYSRILTTGVQLALSWGYAQLGDIGDVLQMADDISAIRQRRGLRVMVMNPSGGGHGGDIDFGCNFWAVDLRGVQQHLLYQDMSRGDMVRQVMTRIGITTPEINFATQTTSLTSETAERQAETDFQFLARKAREWRAYLIVGHDPSGNPVGAFIDVDKITTSAIVQAMTGGTGNSFELNYQAGQKSNVLDFDWQCNEGESGVGAGTQIIMVNGQPTILRYTVEGETVRTWQLNTDRLQSDYGARDIANQFKLTQQIAAATDFESVKRYFDPVDQTTAPNGKGYTMSAKVLGNPMMVPPSVVRFGLGFPDRFTQATGIQFFLRRNTHEVDINGYFSNLEIVDVPTLMETGAQITIPASLPTTPSAQNTSAVPKTQTAPVPLPVKPT